MIACAHLHGLPARYVSGYLHSSADGEPHDAAHAWTEIHVGSLGWVGFDAANACCPDARYVRLGSGYDAQDAAPVRGLTVGSGAESMDVRLRVRRRWKSNRTISSLRGAVRGPICRLGNLCCGTIMTYCVGLKLNAGLVLLSDTRTNAGLDNISTYRKMFFFENPASG